jgi:hypothetical protein
MISNKIKLVTTATGISFLGTLPLGTLNLSIANFAFHHDCNGAIEFAIAAVSVEVLAVRLALLLVDRLQTIKNYYWLFRLISVAVLIALSVSTFISASTTQQFNVAFPLTSKNPFIGGLVLSALNPLHMPFWMGWTTVLKNRGILIYDRVSYNLFVVAIGIGTIMAFGLYGLAGGFLISLLGHWQSVLNWTLSVVLLVTALVQLYKTVLILRKGKQQTLSSSTKLISINK